MGIEMKRDMTEERKYIILDMIQSFIVALFIPITFLRHVGQETKGTFLYELSQIFTENCLTMGLIFIVCLGFFRYLVMVKATPGKRETLLSFIFAVFTVIGCLYSSEYGWIKDYRNILRCIFKLSALVVLYRRLLAFLEYEITKMMQKSVNAGKEEGFLGKKSFRNTTIFLFVLWLPVTILSYPGNLTGDTLMQIWEIMGVREYWAHNPLFHTIILHLFISLGQLLFNSISAGFFLCAIAQSICMALVLGYSMQRLYDRGVGIWGRRIVLAIYALTPAYSNMVTSPGKDMAYMALFLLYILFLEEILFFFRKSAVKENVLKELNTVFWIKLVLVEITLCLVRKNGIYIVVPTGIILTLLFYKKDSFRKLLLIFMTCCIIPLVGFNITQKTLEVVTNAEEASIREMLSIPFQQTARYLNVYGDEISDFEREAINQILLDADLVGRIYTPDISDPVKGLYNNDASTEDLLNYFKAWMIGLAKRPVVYFDAFFQHVYGWFYPGVVNVIRYDATDELIKVPPFFANMRGIIKQVYESLGNIPFLGLLENIGAYVWVLFWLLFRKNNDEEEKWLLFPLFLSLLICMASPAFYDNPRYAYPILISLPFVSTIALSKRIDKKE